MAWVSIHDNVIGGKLRELAKELDSTQEEALGILASLWIWGLNNATKEGWLMSADKDDVLEAFSVKLATKMAPINIVDCLIKTRWIDEPEDGVLLIHDWDRWQEQWYKAMERREKDAKRKADGRKEKPTDQYLLPKESEKTYHAVSRLHEVGVDLPPDDNAPPSPEEPKYTPAFELFYAAYPRKIGKGEAYKKYRTRRKDGYSDEELLKAAEAYAVQCRNQKTEKEYIKHPKTFLSDSLPFLDYLPKHDMPVQEKMPDGINPFAEWGEKEQ